MLFDQPGRLDPAEIVEWHSICVSGLEHERGVVYDCLINRSPLPRYADKSPLMGATETELSQYFSSCRDELDLSAIMFLFASAEARIRLDAQARHHHTDLLAGRINFLKKKYAEYKYIPLYENGIADAWKDYAATLSWTSNQERDRIIGGIGNFKAVAPIRNWVAHGRYFEIGGCVKRYSVLTVSGAIDILYESLNKIAKQGGLPMFKM